MYRILIVDDHPVVRHGVRHILAESGDIEVAGEASGAYEALDKVREGSYDAVLLDIALPDMNGIELLRVIRQVKPKLPVLVLSVYEEDMYAVRAMREGAAGYLTKGSVSQELVGALRQISRGERYITKSLADRLALAVGSGLDKPLHDTLSLREFEVMRLLAEGKLLKTISELLRLSPKTISTYRARIFEKMQFATNEDLIRYARQHGLVD